MPVGYTRGGAGGGGPLPGPPQDTYPDYLVDWPPPAPPPGPPPPPYDVAPNYDYDYGRIAPEGYVILADGTIAPEPPRQPPPIFDRSFEAGPPPPDLIRGGSAWQEPSSSAPPAGQYASDADELGFEPFSMESYASAPLGNNAYYRSYYDALRQQAVAQALAQSQRR